jgi:LacI family transcriptional regulator
VPILLLHFIEFRQKNTIMEENLSRIKISDIAKLAGVSPGTVDRVLHNRGEVAEKTREKIMAIIRELNYEPDILASTLASKKNLRFASLIPQADSSNPFWQSPADGLQEAWLEIKHYGIDLDKHFFPYHDKKAFVEQLHIISESKPSGLIMAPVFTSEAATHLQNFKQSGIPVVFLNAQMNSKDNISFVGQDPFQSGIVAARLLDYGLDEGAEIFIINIISGKGGNSHILNRENGFRQYFAEKNTTTPKQLSTIDINSEDTDELGIKLTQHISRQNIQPKKTGIFVTNSKVFHVAEYLEKNNIEFVNLIGYDLLEQNQEYLKKGTIDFLISQKPREQGYKSIMTLFNYLVMRKQIVKNQFLPIDIITKENIDFYINH